MTDAYTFKTAHGVFHGRFTVPVHLRHHLKTNEFRISTNTKNRREAQTRIRFLKNIIDTVLLKPDKISIDVLKRYLIQQMANIDKKTVPMPFNAHQDEDGRWHFTDVKADEVQSIGDFLKVIEEHTQATATNTSIQNTAIDTRNTKINEPGKLASKSKQRIAKLVNEYIKAEQARADEKEIGVKKVPQILTRLKLFVEVYGGKMIGELTPSDIQEYRKKIIYYPINVHRLRSCVDIPFEQIVFRSKNKTLLDNNGQPAERLSEATVDGYMLAVKNFLDFCIRLYAVNPAIQTGFEGKAGKAKKGVKRRAFNQEELQKIFDSEYYRNAEYNRAYQYWIPLIAAYTGARINEIAQLNIEDIKTDKDGIAFFNITADDEDDSKSIKNEESKRVIPVHQKLIDLGFLDFVKSREGKENQNLFDIKKARADKYGKVPATWFNQKYLRGYLKLDDPAIVFHSFRHRFVTSLSQAIIDSSGISEAQIIRNKTPESLVLRRIVGHSVASSITDSRSSDVHTDTYTGELSVSSMKRVIDKLQYPGVTFHKFVNVDETKRRKVMLTKDILSDRKTDNEPDEKLRILNVDFLK